MKSAIIPRRVIVLFFLPAAAFLIIFMVFPVIKMCYDSFFEVTLGGSTFVGLAQYIKMFTSDTFLIPLRNTLAYVGVSVSVQFVLGLILALLFSVPYKGSKVIRSFINTPVMIAPIVTGLVWKYMFSSQFGIINQYLTVIGILERSSDLMWLADPNYAFIACCIAEIWLSTPFMMLMLLAGISSLDGSMLEAARIDGANWLQQIFRVILPNLKFIIITSLSIRIVDAARSFDIIWALTGGGPLNATELLSITIYRQLTRYNNIGYANAIASVFVLVLMIFTIVFMQNLWNPKKRNQ